MNEREASAILAVLKGNYQDKMTVTPATVKAWLLVLHDVPAADVERVAVDWMSDQEWPPVPAQIRKRLLDAIPGLPSPDEAWRQVQQRIRSTYPGHAMPDWEAPEVLKEAVRDVGGLRAIRFSERPAQTERDFKEAYQERRKAATRDGSLALGEERRHELPG